MIKGYKYYNNPNESYLFPPSPQDWLPKNHLIYFINDLVDNPDLSIIHKDSEKELRGQPLYHPALMTKIMFLCILPVYLCFQKDCQTIISFFS